jgi:hypothetical protein
MGKSTKKSINDSIASCFTEILLMHDRHPACWYDIFVYFFFSFAVAVE